MAESLGLYEECPHYQAAQGVRPTARSVRVFDHCPDCPPPWPITPIMAADGGLLEAATRLTQAEHPAAYMAAFEDVRDAVENATSRPAPPRPAAEGADIRLITIEKQRVALDLLNAYLEIGHPHDELSRSLVAEARRWTSRPDGGPPFAALEVDDGWAIAALNAHEARRQSERADVSESLLKKVRANITTVMAGVESIDDIDALLGMVTPEEEALIASLDAEDAIATPHREWCADLSEFQGTHCECGAATTPRDHAGEGGR